MQVPVTREVLHHLTCGRSWVKRTRRLRSRYSSLLQSSDSGRSPIPDMKTSRRWETRSSRRVAPRPLGTLAARPHRTLNRQLHTVVKRDANDARITQQLADL
jgi:hypothetical protein